ncbi:MAG: ThuA domain-containing protein [Pseudothermotoga sp.]
MKIKIFAGDRYHDKEVFIETLLEVLQRKIYSVQIEESTHIEKVVENNPELIVIARWNLNDDETFWLNEESSRLLAKWVKDGGKLFVWHSGLARYPSTYVELVGGKFLSHPEKTLVRYFIEDGFSFEISDEQYFVNFEKDVEVFLWSESKFGQSTAGWKKNFVKGKILALTPAHDREGLTHEGFKQLLEKCLSWLFCDL